MGCDVFLGDVVHRVLSIQILNMRNKWGADGFPCLITPALVVRMALYWPSIVAPLWPVQPSSGHFGHFWPCQLPLQWLNHHLKHPSVIAFDGPKLPTALQLLLCTLPVQDGRPRLGSPRRPAAWHLAWRPVQGGLLAWPPNAPPGYVSATASNRAHDAHTKQTIRTHKMCCLVGW